MISNHAVFNESFDPEFQSKLRSHLNEDVEWVAHCTPVANLSSIKRCGLLPKETPAIYVPDCVTEHFGRKPEILCLSPFQTRLRWSRLWHHEGEQTFLIARLNAVPSPIGLDWSFPQMWNGIPETLTKSDLQSTALGFCKSILSQSVLLTYDEISPLDLYVLGEESSADDPRTYQRLADVPYVA